MPTAILEVSHGFSLLLSLWQSSELKGGVLEPALTWEKHTHLHVTLAHTTLSPCYSTFEDVFTDHDVEKITCKQWILTGRCELVTVINSLSFIYSNTASCVHQGTETSSSSSSSFIYIP
jgi:hypothetical protein